MQLTNMTIQRAVLHSAKASRATTWFSPVALLLLGGAYLVLATAAFFPSERVDQTFILLNVGWIFLILFVNGPISGKLASGWMVLVPLVLCYIPAASAAVDVSILVKKLEGGVLATLLASALLYVALKKFGIEQMQRGWIIVGAVVLLTTIIYKLEYGFFNRQIRFFVNGPIVFGWLMGSMSWLSIYLATHSKRMTWWILISGLFALAVVWSGSKGPLIALALTTSVILISSGAKRGVIVAGLFIGVIAVLLAFTPEESLDRFRGIGDLMGGEGGRSDGSVAPRKVAWQQAISTFQLYPITGAGLGNFQFFSPLAYPHNLFLESAAETGLLGLVGLLSTLGLAFAMTPPLGRLWLLFFVIAMQFSGDISYLRIALAMPIALAAHKAWQLRQSKRRLS